MEIMSYSEFKKNLASAIDKVNDDCYPIFVTKQNGNKAVLISLDEYNSIQETLYLLGNPINAEILGKSIEQVECGLVQAHELIEV